MKQLCESQYDWAQLPEDLPHKNLVLITAKTPHPTIHKEDIEHPVRLFTTKELYEAARSLAHRPIGLNHQALIERAFTVDAQFNQSTGNVEALCYFPDEWIGKVRNLLHDGKESIFSVEYTWRDEKETAEGTEFIGLIFDKVDLLCGVNAGDKHTSARLVESSFSFNNGTNRKGYCEAEVSFPSAVQEEAVTASVEDPSLSFFKECGMEAEEFLQGKRIEESENVSKSMGERLGEPFADYADFSACVRANKDKSSPERYCGYIKHKVECNTGGKVSVTKPETLGDAPSQCIVHEDGDNSILPKKYGNGASMSPHYAAQEQEGNAATRLLVDKEPIPKQRPAETNLLNNMPQEPVVNQDPPVVEKPIVNVASSGFVQDKDGQFGTAFGGESKEKPEFGMSGSTVPKTVDDKKLVEGTSIGASTTEKNPIVEGLNNVGGPDNSNEDTYNQKKRENKLTENEKVIEQPKAAEPAKEPVKPVEPPVDYKKLYESADMRVKELEPAILKLQENAKTYDAEKAKIAINAKLAGKQEVISKIKKVLPSTSLVSGTMGGAYRVLTNDVKKALYESEQ